jgi:hypothetical protein
MAAVFKALITEDVENEGRRAKKTEGVMRREGEMVLSERMRGKGNGSSSCHLQDSIIILSSISCR